MVFTLFDCDRNLYGKDIEVRFLRYLRPEQKFENLAALREQIALISRTRAAILL